MAASSYRTLILALQSTEEIPTLANILLENYTGSVIEHNFRDMQTLLNIKKEAPFLHAAKDRVASWRKDL